MFSPRAQLPGGSGGGGAGTIGGSTGTIDNALLRADGGGGSTLQASNVFLGDTNTFTVPDGADAAPASGNPGTVGENITFTPGAGGNGDGAGSGADAGDVNMLFSAGGDAGATAFLAGDGGGFVLTGGTGGGATANFGFAGMGGSMVMTGGTGGAGSGANDVTGGTGGSPTIDGGAGGAGVNAGNGGQGGTTSIYGGGGGNTGTGAVGGGGAVVINGGNAGFTGGAAANGGAINIASGGSSVVGGAGGASGALTIQTGTGAFAFAGNDLGGASGNVQIASGSAGSSAGTGNGPDSGFVEITTGNGGSAVTGIGGDANYIKLQPGSGGGNSGGGTSGNGGAVQLFSGDGADSLFGGGVNNVGGDAGNVVITAGDGGNAANGLTDTGGAAGAVTITAGAGKVAQSGGAISLTTGDATGATGNGGDVVVKLGAGVGGGTQGVIRMSGANDDVRLKMQGTGKVRIIDSASTQNLTMDHDGTNAQYEASIGFHEFANPVSTVSYLDTGRAAGATGSVRLNGTTSGTVTLSVADAAGTWTMKLPTTDGAANEFLQTDGAGNTTWAAGGAGAPGGIDTEVQFNDGGAFGGDAGFTYNKATNVVTIGNIIDSGLTASRAVVTDGSSQLVSATTTATEIGYVNGVTSAIQTQLDGKVNDTGNETIAGIKTFSSDPLIPDEAYGVGWNGSLEPPTKNAVYDKIQTMSGVTLGLVTAVNMGYGGTFMQ